MRFVPFVLVSVLWLSCLVDVISSREDGVRHLGKNIWLLLVLLFPFVGSLAWLLVGRPARARPLRRSEGAAPGLREDVRRGRFAPADPARSEEFLRRVRERAEEQRIRYEAQRRPREPSAGEADDPAVEPDGV